MEAHQEKSPFAADGRRTVNSAQPKFSNPVIPAPISSKCLHLAFAPPSHDSHSLHSGVPSRMGDAQQAAPASHSFQGSPGLFAEAVDVRRAEDNVTQRVRWLLVLVRFLPQTSSRHDDATVVQIAWVARGRTLV
ncbi:hypothetical protein AB1Y20_020835 [Prymnesium parvum]|uniref:Uncharacterized protein n=1 Tax=Prymnesium parvum TaxID=97485 RepID=A0AB34JVU9_PRYPA